MRGDMYSDRIAEDFLDSVMSVRKTFLLIEKEFMRASISWIDSKLKKIEEKERSKRIRERRVREHARREVRSVEIEDNPEETSEET